MVKIHFSQKVLKKWSSFSKNYFIFFHNRRGQGCSEPFMEFSIRKKSVEFSDSEQAATTCSLAEAVVDMLKANRGWWGAKSP